MPRGGRRAGRPGVAHGNRTDLNGPPTANFTGQQYGAAAAQARAQSAVKPGPPPTANIPPPPPGAPTGEVPQRGPAPGPPMPSPGALGPLDAPSTRPAEPITHGLPIGAGGGPEVLAQPGVGADALELQLRALYSMYPYPEIRDLLEEL